MPITNTTRTYLAAQLASACDYMRLYGEAVDPDTGVPTSYFSEIKTSYPLSVPAGALKVDETDDKVVVLNNDNIDNVFDIAYLDKEIHLNGVQFCSDSFCSDVLLETPFDETVVFDAAGEFTLTDVTVTFQ